MKRIVALVLTVILSSSLLSAQDQPAFDRSFGEFLLDGIAPGATRIARGDASGWFTVPGTAAQLGGAIIMASRGRGLFDLHQDGPMAAGMLLFEYGNLAFAYDEYWWLEKALYPGLDTPSLGSILLENFRWDLRSAHELLTLGILGIYATYEVMEHGDEMKAYFSSDEVTLWGRRMNPWAAAGLMGGFAVLTNAMVAPVEEISRRAIIIGLMENALWPEAASIAASAALFGAAHLGNMLLDFGNAEYRAKVVQQSIFAGFAGLVMGWLYLSDDTPGHHVGLGRVTASITPLG